MNRARVLAMASALSLVGIGSVASAATVAQWDFDSLTQTGTGATGTSVTPDTSGNHNITIAYGAYSGGTTKGTTLSSDTPYSPATTGDNSVAIYNTSNVTASNIANPGTINLTTNNAFTIQGWMKPSVASNNNYYLSLTNGATGSGLIGIYLNSQGTTPTWHCNLSYGGNGHGLTDTSGLSAGVWNFVAITFDGSNLKMYVQDTSHPTLANVATATGLSVTLPTWTTAQLGTSPGSGNMLYDDFRISDTALTQSQLTASMVSFTPVSAGKVVSLTAAGGSAGGTTALTGTFNPNSPTASVVNVVGSAGAGYVKGELNNITNGVTGQTQIKFENAGGTGNDPGTEVIALNLAESAGGTLSTDEAQLISDINDSTKGIGPGTASVLTNASPYWNVFNTGRSDPYDVLLTVPTTMAGAFSSGSSFLGFDLTQDSSLSHLSIADVAAIPEPASLALLGMGGLLMLKRRRRAYRQA